MTSPKPNHFVIADLHLGHENVLKYARPQFQTLEEHDAIIIANINETCGKNDYLWVLGDVAFTKFSLDLLRFVECHMAMIGGNHDHFGTLDYLKYFHRVKGVAEVRIPAGRALLSHVPMHPGERWEYNIHGHKHLESYDDPRYINVSAEVVDFKPKRISDLISVETHSCRLHKDCDCYTCVGGYGL